MCLFFLATGMLKAQMVNLNIKNVQLFTKTDTSRSAGQTIIMKVGKESDEVLIANMGGLNISARFRIRDYDGVRRSNTKKTMIRMFITYYFDFNGKRTKRHEERMFFMDDDRTFEESIKQVFQEGINNKVFTLTYKGALQ